MLWDYFRIPLGERLRSGSLRLKGCHEHRLIGWQVTLLSSIPCPADRHRDKNVNLGHLEIAVCVRMLLFAHLH